MSERVRVFAGLVAVSWALVAACGSDGSKSAQAGGGAASGGEGPNGGAAAGQGGAGSLAGGNGGFGGGQLAPCTDAYCDPSPPSTLLAAGASRVDFTLRTGAPARCAWSLDAAATFDKMTPFEGGQGTTSHSAAFTGLNPDTQVVNSVTVRCDSAPTQALTLAYRSLPTMTTRYPRVGNLWGSWGVIKGGVEHAARIKLYLGAGLTIDEVKALRKIDPNILVLGSINTVEREGNDPDVPESYWLHDVNGKRIEVWPGAFRLNLTRPEVASFQAQYAYQQLVKKGMVYDGIFFDNFFVSQSGLKADMWGNPVQLDADGDGKPDDPATLDAAWKAGVYAEIREWRKLMPYALASGHLPRPPNAELGSLFNGDSFGFITADVIEGRRLWAAYSDMYSGWWKVRQAPIITMIESSPVNQISYGYSFEPDKVIAPATKEFARTYYPWMRFGLAATLMGDGFFSQDFGDTQHGNDWWYDELDHDLGTPCGPATRVAVGIPDATDLVVNGGFESGLSPGWTFSADAASGASGTAVLDPAEPGEGKQSVKVTVTNTGDGTGWKVALTEKNLSVVAGADLELHFRAKADGPRKLSLSMSKQVADWRSYGLWGELELTQTWADYVVPFKVKETATDARLQFFFGDTKGTTWIDGVTIVKHPADVYRRDFSQGLALVNATPLPQTLTLGPGYSRLTGSQAPRDQRIVDDAEATFASTGAWATTQLGSAMWAASPPFYHAWGGACQVLASGAGDATWQLGIPADDTYTIDAWWAAAPAATGWTKSAVYEVMVGATVVATATLDQSATGDQWHRIAELALKSSEQPVVRVRNSGTGALVADALLLQSAGRFNDGTPLTQVTLPPKDGIILHRVMPGCQ